MICKALPLLLLVLASLGLAACFSTPYTNRRQFILVSRAQETALGIQSYQEVLQESQPSRNQGWIDMVTRCGRRIAAVTATKYEWEFTVLAAGNVNAFALPGGKVVFYEGIMPICRDENGVAVVMGHEIAHALLRHGAERVTQSMLTRFGTEAAASLLGGDDPQTQAMVRQGLGLGTRLGVTLPFSRAHESEADHVGLILMAKAGYDPRVAPGFWTRMQRLGGQRTLEFFSTHPSDSRRIQQLQGWMPEAMQFFGSAGQQ